MHSLASLRFHGKTGGHVGPMPQQHGKISGGEKALSAMETGVATLPKTPTMLKGQGQRLLARAITMQASMENGKAAPAAANLDDDQEVEDMVRDAHIVTHTYKRGEEDQDDEWENVRSGRAASSNP